MLHHPIGGPGSVLSRQYDEIATTPRSFVVDGFLVPGSPLFQSSRDREGEGSTSRSLSGSVSYVYEVTAMGCDEPSRA